MRHQRLIPLKKSSLSIPNKFAIIGAYFKRNARVWSRFKASFLMQIVGYVAQAAIFLIFGIGLTRGRGFLLFGEDYVAYLIIGLVFLQFMDNVLGGPYHSLFDSYWSNRLESVLLSPSSVGLMIMSDTLWGFVPATVGAFCYLLLGWAFGLSLSTLSNIYQLFPIFFLLITSLSGIGLISAAMFTLINAKGRLEPMRWVMSTLQGLVAGIYFPISLLPNFLKTISVCLPQTYLVDSARRILIHNGNEPSIMLHSWFPFHPMISNLVALVIFSVVLMPTGVIIFRLAISKARSDGGLSRWT